VALPLALVLVSVAVFLISIGKRTPPTDCEISQFFYSPNEENSFESFLEKQFRVFGVIEPGSFFSDPRYSFAIYHPFKEHNRYKGYRYLISWSGIPHSRMAISISKEEWESGNRVECEEGFKVRTLIGHPS